MSPLSLQCKFFYPVTFTLNKEVQMTLSSHYNGIEDEALGLKSNGACLTYNNDKKKENWTRKLI